MVTWDDIPDAKKDPWDEIPNAKKDAGIDATQQIQDVPKWGRENPNLYGVYGALKETAKIVGQPIAQAAALAGGALIGGPIGAGLAYGIEQQGEKLLSGEAQKQTLPTQSIEAAKDIATGVSTEMGGQLLSKGVQLAGKGLSVISKPVQKYFYESALKIPPSVPKRMRDIAIEKGIEGQYIPSDKGLAKLKGDIKRINSNIADVIDYSARQGKTVNTDLVLSRLDDLRAFYKNAPDPTPFLAQIDEIANGVRTYRGQTIPLKKAQEIKQTIYQIEKKHYGEMKGLQIESNKAIARGLKEEIVAQNPELKQLNAEDSAMLNLQEVLERSVNRIRNYDVIRFGDTFVTLGGAIVGGPTGAVTAGTLKRLVEAPTVKARIAMALRRAKETKGLQTASRLGAFHGTNLIVPPENAGPNESE